MLPQVTLPPATSVVPLPGAGVLALFVELAAADADLVVVDAGPVADAAELVGLPGTLRWWLDQVLPPGMRALGALRTAAVTAGMARRGPVDAALAAVPVVERLLRSDRLADRAGTAVVLVAQARGGAADVLRRDHPRPRPARVAAGGRARPGPARPRGGDWWSARLAEQEAALAELAGLGPLQRVHELATAPADAAALAGLLADVRGGPSRVVPVTERRDGVWSLVSRCPSRQRREVDLTRWEDDVVITVAGGAPVHRSRPAAAQVRGDRQPEWTSLAPPPPGSW